MHRVFRLAVAMVTGFSACVSAACAGSKAIVSCTGGLTMNVDLTQENADGTSNFKGNVYQAGAAPKDYATLYLEFSNVDYLTYSAAGGDIVVSDAHSGSQYSVHIEIKDGKYYGEIRNSLSVLLAEGQFEGTWKTTSTDIDENNVAVFLANTVLADATNPTVVECCNLAISTCGGNTRVKSVTWKRGADGSSSCSFECKS